MPPNILTSIFERIVRGMSPSWFKDTSIFITAHSCLLSS